ncbi:tRNA lysidine(34) synthetase TilS [Gluconacetobacter takamatsuzukensis]|uniref:tRNA(Ile)-lysidine synthase n=1 Tax=Gluconacetobacter takamatsuzukensis TaxID=1286190 RepID=A0A7W4PN85_9PROT|nr:tRNA lysidine(34) synthetase TilS [Gluconacetobacter takamatsuzukensis]MBB2203798.1 tRNA lysidine(34) synthetase TilS [Gluconacetobacter takamatsuzukensis]
MPLSATQAHARRGRPNGEAGAGILDDGRFAAIMAGLGPWLPDGAGMPEIGIAVSGGADSLCLAYLAGRWRRAVRALIVDHGLRPAASAEARLTRDRLARLGIPSEILVLEGLRPGPGVADRARRARYAALSAACRRAGIVDLLLGHHAGDQAETVMIRRRAASGPDGLAGMGAVTFAGDLRLVRPFLDVEPAVLRGTLRCAGLDWVEDPSNADPRAERARLRAALGADPSAGRRLRAEARQAGLARMARDAGQALWLARGVTVAEGGWVALAEDPACPRMLAFLLRAVSGRDYLPPSRAVAALCADPRPATLAGVCLVAAGAGLRRAGLRWLLLREEGAMQAPVPAVAGCVWDGRFVLSAPAGADLRGVTVGAAGPVGRWMPPPDWKTPWPARALRTVPALFRDGRLVGVPTMGICRDPGLAGVRLALMPSGVAAEAGRFAQGPAGGQ